MNVVTPTWLMYSVPAPFAALLRSGQPHRLRLVNYGGDLRLELVIFPDDVFDYEPVRERCVRCDPNSRGLACTCADAG